MLGTIVLSLLISTSTNYVSEQSMIDTIWVDSSHGLSLNEGPHAHRDNENGVLFYLEYILLKEAQGQDVSEDVKEFKSIVERIRAHASNGADRVQGLYDRGADESLSADKESIRTISHDNLTAIAAFDARYGDGDEAAKIAAHGLKNLLRYDNAYPDKPRLKTIQWPTDWAFWVLSSNKWHAKLLAIPLLPFFLLRCALSSMSPKDDTSGKLLNFVRFASHRDRSILMNLCWRLFMMSQKKIYGDNWLHEIMCIYFHNLNHPLRSLSNNVRF